MLWKKISYFFLFICFTIITHLKGAPAPGYAPVYSAQQQFSDAIKAKKNELREAVRNSWLLGGKTEYLGVMAATTVAASADLLFYYAIGYSQGFIPETYAKIIDDSYISFGRLFFTVRAFNWTAGRFIKLRQGISDAEAQLDMLRDRVDLFFIAYRTPKEKAHILMDYTQIVRELESTDTITLEEFPLACIYLIMNQKFGNYTHVYVGPWRTVSIPTYDGFLAQIPKLIKERNPEFIEAFRSYQPQEVTPIYPVALAVSQVSAPLNKEEPGGERNQIPENSYLD